MADPFLGEIRPFPYGFAPRNWAFCNGQILSIAQNTALFSLLGTTYGGNGQTTFALPNLNDRLAVSSGQGPGLSDYDLGQTSGTLNETLSINQIPAHTHAAATSSTPSTNSPVGALPSNSGGHALYDPAVNTTLDPNAITPVGGGQPHSNVQPLLAINYCIAMQGIFPPRN